MSHCPGQAVRNSAFCGFIQLLWTCDNTDFSSCAGACATQLQLVQPKVRVWVELGNSGVLLSKAAIAEGRRVCERLALQLQTGTHLGAVAISNSGTQTQVRRRLHHAMGWV